MTHKYLRNAHILQVQRQHGSSYVQRSITKALEWLRVSYQLELCNGNTSLWYDNWLRDGPVCDKVLSMHIFDVGKQVKDLWVNGQWYFDSIATLIPDDVKNHITSFPVPQSEVDDGWICRPKVDGNYSATNGYGWLLDRCGSEASRLSWKWVWRIKAPKKVKHLLWLCLHEALPTNMLQCHHGMSQNPGCMRCCGE